MALLKDEDRQELGKELEKLRGPVRMVLFTEKGPAGESEPNQLTRELLEEVASLSAQLSLEVKDLHADAVQAGAYGIDKTPGMVLLGGEKDYGLRYFGVPAGHEFGGFIENLLEVSLGEHGLPDGVLAELAKVDRPVRLQVLFTPS